MAAPPVLAVDLDGTLIRSDMLLETFWSAVGRNWTTAFKAAACLARGRAALKRCLWKHACIDAGTLPYNEAVIEHIRHWRATGGRTVLVTASDQGAADAVTAHLGLFDEVHGSNGETNLKGARKAAFLVERYGERGFAYMGDSGADLPVWEKAAKAVTVDASAGLRARVAAMGCKAEHLAQDRPRLRPAIKALRTHQWLKNVLVFLPMVSAHEITPAMFSRSFLAFVAFSMVASAVYVLNDLLDISADRAHPRKRARPVASGRLPIGLAGLMIPALLGASMVPAFALGWPFALLIGVYFAATSAYSLYFKRLVIIDICALAGFYTLRIVAGAVATGITLSVWLLAFSIFFFLSLAAVKRQAELVDRIAADKFPANGRGYHAGDLPLVANMAISSGYVSVLVMALYLDSPAVRVLYSSPYALWGICLVLLYWISRMVILAHRGAMSDDPVVFAVTDRVSLGCLLVSLCFALAGAVL